MKQNYKSIQILRLFYSELDLFERLETEYAISQDQDMKDEWDVVSNCLNKISSISFSPKEKTLENILAYSKIL